MPAVPLIKAYTYSTIVEGPKLLVLGAIHGDEICGPPAIHEIVRLFEKGEMLPQKGSVTFIPVCNPIAFQENKRFIEVNLNRNFRRRKDPKRYEEKLMNVLAPYLEECDVLLDLHSYRAEGPAFVFRGPDTKMEAEENYAAHLGVEHVIYGWHEAYMNSGVELDPEQSIGTTDYVRKHGGIAVTLECGQHVDSTAVERAMMGIKGALHYCEIVLQENFKPNSKMNFTRLQRVCFKEQMGTFTQGWVNLEKISKGDKIAKLDDGSFLTAPFSGRIVFPYEKGPLGDDWFYLGINESGDNRGEWVTAIIRNTKSVFRFFIAFFKKLLRRKKH